MDRYTFFSWKSYPDIGFMPAGVGTMYNDAEDTEEAAADAQGQKEGRAFSNFQSVFPLGYRMGADKIVAPNEAFRRNYPIFEGGKALEHYA